MFTRDQNRKTSHWVRIAQFVAVLSLAACQSTGDKHDDDDHDHHGTPTPTPNACSKSFDTILHANKIEGHRHLYFDMHELRAIFTDPTVHIDDIDIVLKMKGKYKGDSDEISIDVNGIQAFESGGEHAYGIRKYDNDRDESHCGFKAHKMKLNGAEAMEFALNRMIRNQGLFQLNLHCRRDHDNSTISDATIEIKGTTAAACPSPTATPKPSATPKSTPTPAPTSTPLPAPHTSIGTVSPTGATVASTSMSISFSSDQSGSSFKCALDGAAQSACSSPALLSNLSNGSHSFKVVAINAQGFADSVGATYSWNVDTIAPDVTITSNLPAVTNSTAISVAFTASGAANFVCALDGGSYAACNSPVSYSNLGEGAHSVGIKAVDSLGNVSTSAATFQWAIDLTPPSTQFVDVSPSAAYSNSTNAAFTFAASESGTFECNLDHVGYASCVSPVSFMNMADGSHTFQVRSIDLVGNVGNPASYSWSVDTQAPVISLAEVLPASGLTNAQVINVSFSANELVSFECSLDGAAWASCSSPFSSPIFSEGQHELQISATDSAGNISSPQVIDWVMDYTLPTLAWGAMLPSSAASINSTTFQAEVIPSEVVVLSCSLNNVDLGQSTSPVGVSALPEGSYSLFVSAHDQVGNLSNTLTHVFNVDLTAPIASLSGSVSGLTSQNINTLSFSANEDAFFQCQQDGAGFNPCASPMTISGLADGAHQFDVQATDMAGNVGVVASVQWTVDSTPPVTTLAASRNSNAAIGFSFSSNESLQASQCSLDGAAFGNCSSPMNYSSLSVGSHTFSVRGVDLAGNVESAPPSYAWVVDAPATTSITAVSMSSYTNATSATFSFNSNVSGASFVCSLDGGAAVACSSPNTYSGLANGAHSFMVQAIDSWGTADPVGASYSWTVDTIAPNVTSLTTTVARTSITVAWTTDEASSSKVLYGSGSNTNLSTAEDMSMVTSHSKVVTGLLPNNFYSVIGAGQDRASNGYQSSRKQVKTLP